MKNILIIFSGNTISGAEIVFKDYFINRKIKDVNFFAVCANDFKIKDFLISCGIKESNIFQCKYFSQFGAKNTKGIKGLFLKLKKIVYIYRGKNEIKKIMDMWNINLLYAKNTPDIVFIPLNTKIPRINHIHDILAKSDLIAKYIRRYSKKLGMFIAVSKAVKNALIDINVSKDKVRVVYNGIAIKKELFDKNEIVKDKVLIWIGNLEDGKNPLEFLDIIKAINEKECNLKGKIIYKNFEENVRNIVFSRIEKESLPISILYNLDREKILWELHTAFALVLTSRKDSFPTVILEAYSVGTPIIAKNIPGVNEMVINMNTGILYNNLSELMSNWTEKQGYFLENHSTIKDAISFLITNTFTTENKINLIDSIFQSFLGTTG